MRIATWNVGHAAGSAFARRTPASKIAAVVAELDADVVVLTEYVPRECAGLEAALAHVGLRHTLRSEDMGAGNSVLIASKSPSAVGNVQPPSYHRTCSSNVLHAELVNEGLQVFGVRVPMCERDPERLVQMWNWIDQVGGRYRSEPAILLGDLNVDPERCRRSRYAGNRFKAFAKLWQHAAPSAGASYYTVYRGREFPKAIDHAFISGGLVARRAEYHERTQSYLLVDRERPKSTKRAVSDHAALVVESALAPR